MASKLKQIHINFHPTPLGSGLFSLDDTEYFVDSSNLQRGALISRPDMVGPDNTPYWRMFRVASKKGSKASIEKVTRPVKASQSKEVAA